MAIDLLHSFFQKGQAASAQPKSDTVSGADQTPQSQQVMRAVQALQAGQTIQGEILSVKGDEVQLSVMNQMVLEARLEQSISLTPGMLMAFQVKSNNSSGVSLMPLFTNTAVDPNAMKALDMAGIPLNERTLEMVQNLMQRGLPIDKHSLQEVYRDIIAYKDSAPSAIISLRQMNMPVTAENLSQLSLYENNQHFLSHTFEEIGQAIGKQLFAWVQEGNPEKAEAFLAQLRQIFNSTAQPGQGEQIIGNNPEANQQASDPHKPSSVHGQEGKVPGQLPDNNEILLKDEKQVIIREEGLESFSKGKAEEFALKEDVAAAHRGQNNQEAQNTGLPENNLWNQLTALLSQERGGTKIASMFQKLWNQEIKPQLLLAPEQVMEKEKVQEFYEKLSRQMQRLEALTGENGQSSSPLAKAVQNTVSNLDFMNQMNQMHGYIQLPLKLTGQEARGELYVFTNKRSMASKEGRVTALLHLDMEYLGKMDVFVALENQKVSTQFYLEKEEYLDFLEKNMDMLSARLNKRGYQCSTKTCLRREETEKSVMEQIVGQQSQPVLLSAQAFDMRA